MTRQWRCCPQRGEVLQKLWPRVLEIKMKMLQCVQGTVCKGLMYSQGHNYDKLVAYTDGDFATDQGNRRPVLDRNFMLR